MDLGPRPGRSPASARARDLIGVRLRQAGWSVDEQVVESAAGDGQGTAVTNLVAKREGSRRRGKVVIVATHYDTPRVAGDDHPHGTSDRASGAAILLEAARVLAGLHHPLDVWLTFFDGRHAIREDRAEDGGRMDDFLGSEAMALTLVRSGELSRVSAVLVVDRVADHPLQLTLDARSSPRLQGLFFSTAQRLGHLDLVPGLNAERRRILGDHIPFARLGLPVLAISGDGPGSDELSGIHDDELGQGRLPQKSLQMLGETLVELLLHMDEG
jgi:hypothetical protein